MHLGLLLDHLWAWYWIVYGLIATGAVFRSGQVWTRAKGSDSWIDKEDAWAAALCVAVMGCCAGLLWPIAILLVVPFGIFKVGSLHERTRQRLRVQNKALRAEAERERAANQKIVAELEADLVTKQLEIERLVADSTESSAA